MHIYNNRDIVSSEVVNIDASLTFPNVSAYWDIYNNNKPINDNNNITISSLLVFRLSNNYKKIK